MIGYGLLIARICLAVVFSIVGSTSCRIGVKHRRGRRRQAAVAGGFRRGHRLYPARRRMPRRHGIFAWLGALVLAGFTVAATVVGHRFWLRRGAEFRRELTTSLEHVATVGGLLLISLLDLKASGRRTGAENDQVGVATLQS
jgi:hypothetical protein